MDKTGNDLDKPNYSTIAKKHNPDDRPTICEARLRLQCDFRACLHIYMDVWIVVLLKYIHSLPKPTILLNNIQVRIESMFARIVGEGKFGLLSENLYSTQSVSWNFMWLIFS